ncbi:MAG: PAS domain-containing protein, partial [Candidatus Omnitrophota bacterium]
MVSKKGVSQYYVTNKHKVPVVGLQNRFISQAYFEGTLSYEKAVFSGQIRKICGFSKKDFINSKISWLDLIYPDDRRFLLKNNRKLLTLYKAVPVPVYIWQKQGDDFFLSDYNDAAAIITEGGIRKYVGSKLSKMYKDDPSIIKQLWQCYREKRIIKIERYYEFRSCEKPSYVNIYYSYVSPDIVIVHTADISERKLVKDQLIESQQEKSLILDTMIDSVVYIDSDFKVIWANRLARQQVNKSEEEIKGCFCYKVWFNCTGICAWCPAKKVLKDGNPEKVDFYTDDGKTMLVQAFPAEYKNKELKGILVIKTDISERRQREDLLRQSNNNLEKELENAKRLSDLGAVSATLAHELRNPLAVIKTAVYNIRKKGNNANSDLHLINIDKKVLESDKIIGNLLNYSRIKAPIYEKIDINSVLDECIADCRIRYYNW